MQLPQTLESQWKSWELVAGHMGSLGPPNGWFSSKGNGTPAISGKSRLVKYYNLAGIYIYIYT